jgi:hypothetical protein
MQRRGTQTQVLVKTGVMEGSLDRARDNQYVDAICKSL